MRLRDLKLALAFTVASAVASEASLPMSQSGATFIAYFGADAQYVDFVGPMVRTLSTSSTWLVASVAHHPRTTNVDQLVYVDGVHLGAQATTLTLWSQDYTGVFLGAVSTTTYGAGPWRTPLSLTAAQTPRWAYLSVLASVPANGRGDLVGVTVPY